MQYPSTPLRASKARARRRSPMRTLPLARVFGSRLMMMWLVIASFFLFVSPLSAQSTGGCTGWLCGAKQTIQASPAFSGNAAATAMIDLAFICLQFVVVIVVGYFVVTAILLLKRNEDI